MSGLTKTPFVTGLNKFADDKLADAFFMVGKTLPCSVVKVDGGIVTVKFEVKSGFQLPQVVVPVCGSEYYRIPVQVGDLGVVMAVGARITNVTGLGALTPSDLSQPPNLTALVFMPVGNTAWWKQPGDQAVIYGPNGVKLNNRLQKANTKPPEWELSTYLDLTTDKVVISIKNDAVTLTMTSDSVTIKGNTTINGNVNIQGNLHVTGPITCDAEVTAKTVALSTHIHIASGGTGNGGPPLP